MNMTIYPGVMRTKHVQTHFPNKESLLFWTGCLSWILQLVWPVGLPLTVWMASESSKELKGEVT